MAKQFDVSMILGSSGNPVKLGEGQFGSVYKVRKDGQTYALKHLKNPDKSALKEIEVLKECEHDNIIGYKGSFEKKGAIFILMEFANFGTLTKHVEKFESDAARWRRGLGAEFNTWRFISHLTSAFHYMHEKHIMHRDLKPDNILGVNDGDGISWKLGDFGLAKLIVPDDRAKFYAHTQAGTMIYMAPEVLLGNKYSFAADIWSFGAVMAFYCNNGEHLLKFPAVNWKGADNPLPGFYSQPLRELIVKMLLPDPNDRPTALDIVKQCSRDRRQEQTSGGKEDEKDSSEGRHPGVRCDGCSGKVCGNRFKCVECDNYDLCSTCFNKNRHKQHNMTVIRPPKGQGDASKLAMLMLMKALLED